ncbi:MAG: hypothetical protein ACQESV_03705 [Thermodesulfobacteriota bacterium]
MRVLGVVVVLMGVLAGCAAHAPKGVQVPEESRLAVAGFTHPQENWEFLAGFVPSDADPMPEDLLPEFNQYLLDQVHERFSGRVLGPHLTAQCREVVLAESDRMSLSALDFWIQVGRCLPVDYLIVPQVFSWQERRGGEWGAQESAEVVLELYLLDITEKRVQQRYRFDEHQQSLSENLLSLPRFMKRHGKWVTADELTREGIRQGLEALGI